MSMVSVLMPVFNGEKYLDQALDSVLTQDHQDFEVVAVDDGSTDATLAILQTRAETDSRLKVVTIENGGIVAALNRGLDSCRGDYIARMDADDICADGRLRRQATYLDLNPQCVLVGGLAMGIDQNGRQTRLVSGGPHTSTDLSVFPPKVSLSIHPLIMVRRQALLNIGGYRNNFEHAEDYDLFLRLHRYGTIENPDWVVLQYRRHAEAVSQRHLEAQERAAALAELDAIRTVPGHEGRTVDLAVPSERTLLRDAGISAPAFETYVRYRIWRRRNAGHLDGGPANTVGMMRAILTLRSETLLDWQYSKLRVRLAGGVLRNLARRRLRRTSSVWALLPFAGGSTRRHTSR